ncbi:MAG: ATP-binding protein, partial [Anaerolineae bacterium]
IQWDAGEEQRYYDTRVVALKKRFGQQTGRLIVLRDITQRKQAEKTLRQANRQLQAEAEKREALIADLDTFAHMVAHDLKNPLAVMLGNITLLEKAVTTDPDLAKQLIRTSDSAGLKMLRMIEELLLLANLRRGTVTPEPVGMDAIIKEARFRLGSMIQQTSTNIIMPDSWPLARGYAPWVEEIWANYLSNGMKYGGTPPTLRLGATVLDNGFVRFFVQDNGDGLSPEEQASIFGEFSRLPGRRATGHGLGLSIVKNIVERLGGEVGVESTHMPGEGCIFSFTLPCCKPDDVEEPALALETA